MKKFFLFVPVVAILAMSSCKKDYTCNCLTTNKDTSFVSLEIEQDITVKATKGKSEDECKEYEVKFNNEYGVDEVTTTCKIK